MKTDNRVAYCVWIFIFGAVGCLWGQTATVKGVITDKASRQPLNGVKVTLASTQSSVIRFELISDKNGEVLKKGLVPGIYQIMYEKSGYVPASTTARFSITGDRDISVELEPIREEATSSTALKKGIDGITAGDYRGAVTEIEAGITMDAMNPMLYFYRGFAREKLGETEEALADYLKAYELKPDFLLALSSAGKLHARRGEYDRAVGLFAKADSLGTRDTVILYNYGVCLINLGRSTDAVKIFEKLLGIDPDNADALYESGLLTLGAGDMARAKELLTKFLTVAPGHEKAATVREILKSL